MRAALLQVEDLRVQLRRRRSEPLELVRGVSFEIGEGEVVGIVGESGSGKTLSAMSVIGLQPPPMAVSGTGRFAGTDLVSARPTALRRIRGADIGVVFQDSLASLHPMLTVGTQITESLHEHQSLSRRQGTARAIELLDQVRIPDPRRALRRYPHEFSGGMRQRVAIAVALACSPRLLIADEPTTALDVTVQAGILALVDELRREVGLSVLMITHDLGVLSAVADRLYVFYGGQIVESGRTGEVVGAPRHPYTAALIEAVPHEASLDATLTAIPGAPPRAGDWPAGCGFAPRCVHARESCHAAAQALHPTTDTRTLRCDVDPIGSA